MTTFSYRCAEDGSFDVVRPIGTALKVMTCPTCGTDAVRVYTAPMLSFAPASLMRVIEGTEMTRETPAVVSALPSTAKARRTSPTSANPALSRLPRP